MSKPNEIIEAFVAEHPEVLDGTLTEKELNGLVTEYQKRINDRPLEDFDGLSALQMHILLHAPFSPESILQFQTGMATHVPESPFFRLSEILLHEISLAGNLKLTVKGNLPVRICEHLCSLNLIEWRYIRNVKRVREEEIPYLWPLKQYLLEEGIVKKRHNSLSLTSAGKKYMDSSADERFIRTISYFANRFHWGNLYHLHDPEVYGQLGWAYSLVLLSRYGSTPLDSSFYSQKIAQAFYKEFVNRPATNWEDRPSVNFHYAFQVRVLEFFALWFGLIQIKREREAGASFTERLIVTKSPLFDKLFKITA